MLEKFLGLVSIGSSFANLTILHRFLSKLIIVIALTIVCALMAGALLIVAFYALYCTLLSYSLGPSVAILVVVLLALILLAILTSLTLRELGTLRRKPPHPRQGFSEVTNMGGIAEAFIQGLCGRSNSDHRSP